MQFKYKAYKNLLAELGRMDYVVELSEIAIKDFLKNLNNAGSPEQFLEQKCKEHNIWVSLDSSNTSYNQSILGYISGVYHLFEAFLYEMKEEYKLLTDGESINFNTETTKLNQIINYFKSKGRFNNVDYIPSYLIDIFEYYHVLRIYFSHKKTVSINEIKNKWEKAKLHSNEELYAKYRINNSPKELNEVDFEDYFLFTQICKELALRISSLCYPDPDKLAISLKRFKKYENESEIIKRLEIYLLNEYAFVKEDDYDKSFLKSIFTHL